jgi:L-histidine Nalpha-methyltransferase
VPVEFASGEYIITEHSHKYAPGEFQALAAGACFISRRIWIDDEGLFSLQYMTLPAPS